MWESGGGGGKKTRGPFSMKRPNNNEKKKEEKKREKNSRWRPDWVNPSERPIIIISHSSVGRPIELCSNAVQQGIVGKLRQTQQTNYAAQHEHQPLAAIHVNLARHTASHVHSTKSTKPVFRVCQRRSVLVNSLGLRSQFQSTFFF